MGSCVISTWVTKDKIDFHMGIGTDRVAFSFDNNIMNETKSASISAKH